MLPLIFCVLFVSGVCYTEDIFPDIPNQFTVVYEHVNFIEKQVHSQTEYYDYDAKLFRFDLIPERDTYLGTTYGIRPLLIVNDYNTGHQYVTDMWSYNCTITDIPPSEFPSSDPDHGYVHMLRSINMIKQEGDLFYRLPQTDYVRGIPCTVWEITGSNGSYHRAYFMKKNWEYRPEKSKSLVKVPLLAIKHYDFKDSLVIQTNVVDFSQQHFERNVFYITFCHSWNRDVIFLYMLIKGSIRKHGLSREIYLRSALKNLLADMAKISPIRINNLYFYYWNKDHFVARGRINDVPVHGNVKKVITGISASEAYENLESALSVSKPQVYLNVSYPEGNEMIAIEMGSLTLVYNSSTRGRSSPPETTSINELINKTSNFTSSPTSMKTTITVSKIDVTEMTSRKLKTQQSTRASISNSRNTNMQSTNKFTTSRNIDQESTTLTSTMNTVVSTDTTQTPWLDGHSIEKMVGTGVGLFFAGVLIGLGTKYVTHKSHLLPIPYEMTI